LSFGCSQIININLESSSSDLHSYWLAVGAANLHEPPASLTYTLEAEINRKSINFIRRSSYTMIISRLILIKLSHQVNSSLKPQQMSLYSSTEAISSLQKI
jgi:hypothetical protein